MVYVFGNYELDTYRRELRTAGMPVKLERQVFRVLVYLVQHRDRVVTKEELFERLWPERFVSDWALARCIALARETLGDSGRRQQIIKTLHGEGYRFSAIVEERDDQTTRGATLAPRRIPDSSIPLKVFKACSRIGWHGAFEARTRHRAASPFVGRVRELTVLHEVLEQVDRGRGQVVGIIGEAGIGKSRLLSELCQSLRSKRLAYQGRCRSYGSTIPYLPWLDLIRQQCGISAGDLSETIVTKVQQELAAVGLDPEAGAPYLLQLLGHRSGAERLAGHSPEVIKARTLAFCRQMLLNRCQRQPLVLVIEDLHWIDPLSEELCVALVEHLVAVPLLFLVTYRPGYQPPWIAQSYVTQLALHPLSLADSLTVVRAVHATAQGTDPVVQDILAKAEGNPFFLEELTLAVLGHGTPQAPATVPDTIQGVLMTRIDRLPREAKHLLQAAAVLGREFPLRLLEAMWEKVGALTPLLRLLQQQEFLYAQAGAGEPVSVFKHALTQEVAYEALSLTRRQALHVAAGRALETLYADRLEEVYDRLAYHYARTVEAAKAVTYLTRFAEQATREYAHAEAAKALETALEHVERLPDPQRGRRRLEVVLQLGHSYSFLGRFAESLDLLLRHHASLEHLQSPELASPYYFRLGRTYSLLGDQERAAQQTRRALAEAVRCGDKATMGKAYYELARELFLSGPPQRGLAYGQRAVTFLEQAGERWWLGMAYWIVAITHALLGAFASALEATANARTVGETLEEPHIQSYAAFTAGWIEAMRSQGQAAITACQRSLAQAQDPVNIAHAKGVLGYAYLEQGDATQAMPLLQQAIQAWQQFRLRPMQAWMTTLLGEAYLLQGQLVRARDLVQQGLTLARGARFQFAVGLAQRGLGRIAQAGGALTEATTYLTAALETFTAIQARFELGRTHLDLATLAHAQGDTEMAATHLAEAHALFRAIQVPREVEQVVQRASALDASLPAIPLGSKRHRMP